MIQVIVTFDQYSDQTDVERAIRGLDKILKLVHHSAQIESATIGIRQVVPELEVIDVDFTVVVG